MELSMSKSPGNKDKTDRKRGGRFVKGQSGNPRGRPKADFSLADLARQHTEEGLQVLLKLMRNDDVAPNARIAAVGILFDRGYGKAPQTIEATVTDLSTMSIEDRRARLEWLLTNIVADKRPDVRH